MYSKFLIENINRNLFITSHPQLGSQSVFHHVPARKLYCHINKLHRAIVDNWNSVIGKDDFVLCLGDFTQNLKHKKKSMSLVEKYLGLVNGKYILIRGNHDAEDTSWYYDCGWNYLIGYPLSIQNRSMSWLYRRRPGFAAALSAKLTAIEYYSRTLPFTKMITTIDGILLKKSICEICSPPYRCDLNMAALTDFPHRLQMLSKRA